MIRRWPALIGHLVESPPPMGMLARDVLATHGSAGWDAEHLARSRIASMLTDLEQEARTLAEALGQDAMPRSGPLFSIYPTFGNRTPDACCAWRASGGRTFVASSVPLPSLLEAHDLRMTGFDSAGRPVGINVAPAD